MEVKLRKIGIVEEADVKLEGLTVIVGGNNSGKTTVGKAIYAVADGLARLKEFYRTECDKLLREKFWNIVIKFISKTEPFLSLSKFASQYLFGDTFSLLESIEIHGESKSYENGIQKFYQEIQNDEYPPFLDSVYTEDIIGVKMNEAEKREAWAKSKPEVMEACEEALALAKNLPSISGFSNKLIQQNFLSEFSGQIQPIHQMQSGQPVFSSVCFYKEENLLCIKLAENQVLPDSVIPDRPAFEQVFLVDDPFVLDALGKLKSETSLRTHQEKLSQYLQTKSTSNLIEELALEERLKPILEKINAIVPGTLLDDKYSHRGIKVPIGNMATGSKLFSILKKILMNGDLNRKTLLILDEPESHLHPEWIGKLAEILVLLVKEEGLTVLLTTHSPDFLLAVDAYMRKYDILKRCHFYRTEPVAEGSMDVKYVEKTDSLNEIYADYAGAFQRMNALRKQYMDSEE